MTSPKTPGGISKSLLTPIRRLGLSRKWKKSGTSPFVSPLAGNIVNNNSNEEDSIRSRKRKCADDETQYLPLSPNTDTVPPLIINADTENTPVRKVATIRKKCKTLISSPVDRETSEVCTSTVKQNKRIILNKQKSNDFPENKQVEDIELNEKSDKINKNKSSLIVKTEETSKHKKTKEESIKTEGECSSLYNKEISINEPKVPNLTKECIVVIQTKINKTVNNEILSSAIEENIKENNSISQVLFDSDSDDVPLSSLNKKGHQTQKQNPENLDNDDLVHSKNNNGSKKEKSNTVLNTSKKARSSKITEEKITQIKQHSLKINKDHVQADLSSQKSSYFDDDDDDDFELNKKTILIKRSYDKVIKPSKSKSTGSITQKDIDEIRARIEMKKELLIAKSMTKDTEELRGLIKKWQKGCQDALMELLDLMRKKVPDQANMNYSYILEMLKIPPSLVGYNEENECFSTPDDNSILTAAFNDV